MDNRNGNNADNGMLDVKQAAKYLNMSCSTLYKKTCSNQIPYNKPAGKLLFSRSDLDSWLRRGK